MVKRTILFVEIEDPQSEYLPKPATMRPRLLGFAGHGLGAGAVWREPNLALLEPAATGARRDGETLGKMGERAWARAPRCL